MEFEGIVEYTIHLNPASNSITLTGIFANNENGGNLGVEVVWKEGSELVGEYEGSYTDSNHDVHRIDLSIRRAVNNQNIYHLNWMENGGWPFTGLGYLLAPNRLTVHYVNP